MSGGTASSPRSPSGPYFLVVLSPAASASKWVPQEMAIAFRQYVELGKHLLPVRVAPGPRRADWSNIQEFDFQAHDDPARYAATLADLLRALGVVDTVVALGAVQPASIAQNPPAAAEPTRPLSATERLAREAHTAYGREHWSDVLDKTEILAERGAMTPTLWRERASAAFAQGDDRNGLAAVEAALNADPDDVDTLLLRGRLYVKAGEDVPAVTMFTHAHGLAPLDDNATRLLLLDDLTAALARLGRWDEFTQRVSDARRMAPDDAHWLMLHVEGLLRVGQYEDAIALAQAIPHTTDALSLQLAWKAALAATMQAENWTARKALLDAAAAAGADAATVIHWRRFDVPRFIPLTTLSGHTYVVNGVAWAPDGTRIATASSDKTARVWEAASAQLLMTLSDESASVLSVAWSPDGSRLATATYDGKVKV